MSVYGLSCASSGNFLSRPMAIRVTCHSCGKNYSIPDQHAGKRFQCKQCQNPIAVPAGHDNLDDDDSFLADLDLVDRPQDRSTAQPRLAAMPSAAKKPTKKKKSSSDSGNSAGKTIGVLIAVLVCLVGVVSFVLMNGSPSDKAPVTQDVSEWDYVSISPSQASVRMPGKRTKETTQGVDGPVRTYNFDGPNASYTASCELYGERDDAESRQAFAASLRNGMISLSESDPTITSYATVGPLESFNGHWSFKTRGTSSGAVKEIESANCYIFVPFVIITLQYTADAGFDQQDAERYFATFEHKPGTDVSTEEAAQPSTEPAG